MTQPIAQASKVGKGNTLHTSKKVEGQVFERLLTNTLEKKHQPAENSSPADILGSSANAETEEDGYIEISSEDSTLDTVESTEESTDAEYLTYLSPYQGFVVAPVEGDWTVTEVGEKRIESVPAANLQVNQEEGPSLLEQNQQTPLFLSGTKKSEVSPGEKESAVVAYSSLVELHETKIPFFQGRQDEVHLLSNAEPNNLEGEFGETLETSVDLVRAEWTLESGIQKTALHSSDLSVSVLEETITSDEPLFSANRSTQSTIVERTHLDVPLQPEANFEGTEEVASIPTVLSKENGIDKEESSTFFETQTDVNTHSGTLGHTNTLKPIKLENVVHTTSVQEIPEMLKELSVQVVSSHEQVGTFETTLHVAPEHLGKLTIQIQKKLGSLEALITVEKSETKDMIEKQWDSIQQLLSSTDTKQVHPLLQKIDIQIVPQLMDFSGSTASFEQRQRERHVSKKRHTFSKKSGHKKDTLSDTVGLKTGRISLLV